MHIHRKFSKHIKIISWLWGWKLWERSLSRHDRKKYFYDTSLIFFSLFIFLITVPRMLESIFKIGKFKNSHTLPHRRGKKNKSGNFMNYFIIFVYSGLTPAHFQIARKLSQTALIEQNIKELILIWWEKTLSQILKQNSDNFLSQQRPYACQIAGCTKRYTDPSSLRKHVKNHDHKGRRKSHKESTGSKLTKKTTKRRTLSESSLLTCATKIPTTPSTPLTPHIQQTKFDFDDVFADDPQPYQSNVMNFDEMSNCLMLMDHSAMNGDNNVATPTANDFCYKSCDNNYDSINYVEQHSELNNFYFT